MSAAPNFNQKNSTSTHVGQVPRGESQYIPKPRDPLLDVYPCQFYVPGPISEGGDDCRKRGVREQRCEMKCAWWKIRVAGGWSQPVEALAKWKHWNLRTARKYDDLLLKQKQVTRVEGPRQFRRDKRGRIIGEIVNRQPHLEKLLPLGPVGIHRVPKNRNSERPKMGTPAPVRPVEPCQPVPPEPCKQGSFRRSSNASKSKPDQPDPRRQKLSSCRVATELPPIASRIETEPSKVPLNEKFKVALRRFEYECSTGMNPRVAALLILCVMNRALKAGGTIYANFDGDGINNLPHSSRYYEAGKVTISRMHGSHQRRLLNTAERDLLYYFQWGDVDDRVRVTKFLATLGRLVREKEKRVAEAA